ncbi:MAG: TonB-dependent receptor [Pseudomonadota bacterium]
MKRTALMMSAAMMALTGFAAPAAMAQESEASVEQGDVITVTARRREESLLDTPVAVTAFGADDINNLGIQSVDDIARFTPGLSFSAAFGRSTERPVIRGQSNVLAGVQFGVESGTAYFIDGIYFPGSISSLDPNDIERIEVIKGPQSALYGRNTYAGAVNYVTRGATDEFEANARVRAGTYGEREVAARIAGPLVEDRLGYSLTIRDYQYDGEWNNAVTGDTVGSESSFSLSGVLDAQFTPNFSVRTRVMYYEDDDGTLPLFLQPSESNNCSPGFRSNASFAFSGSTNNNQYYCGVIHPAGIALNTGPVQNPRAVPGVPLTGSTFFGTVYDSADGTAFDGIARDGVLASVAAEWDIGGSGFVLTAQAQGRAEEDYFGSDSDHSSVNWFLAPSFLGGEAFFSNTNRGETNDYSFELKLESPTDRAFRWLVGAYYYDELAKNFDFDFTNIDTGGIATSDLGITNQAIFGLVEYDFSEALTLTVEARYAEEEKTRVEYGAPVNPTANPFERIVTLDQAETFDSFTPRITLDYSSDLGNFYAVFAQGVKPGGLNGSDGAQINRDSYDQEESDNFEIGYKNTFLDGDALFTGAAFYTDASNVQVTQAIANSSGNAVNSVAINQGAAEIWGVELSWNHQATDYFNYALTYAWTSPEFTQGCDDFQWTLTSGGGVLDPGSSAPGTGADFSGNGNCSIAGNQLPLTSEHQFSAFGEFRYPIGGDWDFVAQSDLTYESSKYVQVHNLAETGDATLVGLRLGIETEDLSFRIWGRNITDEDSIVMATRWLQTPYFSFASLNTAGFVPGADTGTPRAFFGTLRRGPSWGVEARMNF